jgi:hypothetical protein
MFFFVLFFRLRQFKFENAFANLVFDWIPFSFVTLTNEERQLIKVVDGERSGFRENGFKVVRWLEKILTIPSHILMMSDESYSCHLTITEQMIFNVRNSLVFLFNFGFKTIVPNIYFYQIFMMYIYFKRHWMVEKNMIASICN